MEGFWRQHKTNANAALEQHQPVLYQNGEVIAAGQLDVVCSEIYFHKEQKQTPKAACYTNKERHFVYRGNKDQTFYNMRWWENDQNSVNLEIMPSYEYNISIYIYNLITYVQKMKILISNHPNWLNCKILFTVIFWQLNIIKQEAVK